MSKLVPKVARGIAIVGVLCTSAGAGCDATPRPPSILARTRSLLLTDRFTLGRLVGQRPGPCESGRSTQPVSGRGCPKPLRIGTEEFARFERLAREVRRVAASDTGAATLHALALVDLRAADGARPTLDRVAAALERARASAPGDPAVLNDLAVVYLEVGERDQRLEPMLRALDTIDQAVRRSPALPEALFNRALILERLCLVGRARAAWSTVLTGERETAWRREASEHVQRLALSIDTLTARDYPQQAREAVFRLLGDWGKATLAGDVRRADSLLGVARIAGDSVTRLGADRSITRAVHWLGSAGNASWRGSTVARAVTDFAQGIRLVDDGRYDKAERALTDAEVRLLSLGAPVAAWAAVYRATAEMNQRQYGRADHRLRLILREALADDFALRGRATWLRGTIALRQGEFEGAYRFYAASRPYFARAGDAKSEASVSFALRDAYALAGRAQESHAEAYRGLHALQPYRQSLNLHSHLLGVADLAQAAGLRHAARELADEAVAVHATVRRPDVSVVGLGTRARHLAALGDSAGALTDLDSASRVAERLTGVSRRFAQTSIDLARGRLLRFRDASAALALLTRAANSYRELGVWPFASRAVYELALVARDAGQTDVARARLLESIALLERPVGSFTSAESRSAFDETVERVFDAMIDLELDAGRPEVAYTYLERERAGVWARPATRGVSHTCATACALASVARTAPPGLLFVNYAVLPDRIAIWFASSRGTGHRVMAYPRDSLAALVRRFGRESAGTTAADLATRAHLHTLLLAPLADQLEGVRHLAVVPDRELTGLPFAALWDARAGRYVVADYTVRTVPSGAFVRDAWSLSRVSRTHASAFVVGNPTMDSLTATRLDPLPGADREARAIAGIYPRSRMLTGARASRAAVTGALARYPIVHFAGHAVFDEVRPERSYLALAADDARGTGRLEAREIAAMRLSNTGIVVLSACRTLNSRPSRTGAVAGLAYSFLRAGVPATVSTLWDVRDDAVTDVMLDFHHAAQRGVDAPAALRRAQLAALASARAEQRAPAAWAAFVYSGP